MRKLNVGLLGCGDVSDIYFENCKTFEILEITACASLHLENARKKAEKHAIPRACRRVMDEGLLGDPLGAVAFMVCHGHEWHHPNPAFFYQAGGGPLLDMGPYYLTALVSLLGPAGRCCGFAKRTFSERTIESGPRRGERLPVEVPTHICGNIEFAGGTLAAIGTSFDVWDSQLPRIEVYGTKGTLCLPDLDPLDGPNLFGGPVWVKTREKSRWRGLPRAGGLEKWDEVAVKHRYNRNSRGLGLADMAYALRDGRPPRASAEMAYHCLEIMHGLLSSAEQGKYYNLQSGCARPASLPVDFPASEDEGS